MQCGRIHRPMTRRDWLTRAANGFGGAALLGLAADKGLADQNPFGARRSHFAGPAKHVIFLFMDGGPSQVDTFDPKPRLEKEHGEPIKVKVEPTQFNDVGRVLKSPWKFAQHGESGIWVSELFPQVARHVDKLAIVRSVVANFSEHTNANYFFHSGSGLQGRPSAGAWVTYGLGSECQNLPGFVVLHSGMIPPGGMDCFHSGFLPATFQGSLFKWGAQPVADLERKEQTEGLQKNKLDLLRKLDQKALDRFGSDDAIESAISNFELAARMQLAVPSLMEISTESKAIQELYGIDQPATAQFGQQCLVARRLVERGVRFIELLCPNLGTDRWDQHGNLQEGHTKNALAVDRPIAGLLEDLHSRGLLEETLVIWGGEFGRTPMAQGSNGRDHNPFGFTIWMAGGGIKGGTVYGATDEYGYHAIENRVEVHDLHATMLHLLGMDHKRLTIRHSGRDMRLTDVHGHVIDGILA